MDGLKGLKDYQRELAKLEKEQYADYKKGQKDVPGRHGVARKAHRSNTMDSRARQMERLRDKIRQLGGKVESMKDNEEQFTSQVLEEVTEFDRIEEQKQPPWFKAAEADEAVGKAYRSLSSLKAAFDEFEEIPSDLQRLYKAVTKGMNAVGAARKDTNTVRELVKKAVR